MAKDDRDKRLRRGQQLLIEWGAAADAEVAALGELIDRDPAADLAIVERLGSSDESAVPLLLRIETESSDKLLKREARRSLYRLEQRGVDLPKRELAEAAAPLAAPPPIDGSMSPVDGRGDQMLWIEKRTGRGSDFIFAVINDPEGLRELDMFHASRKEVLAAQEEMLQKNQIRLVPVDWHHCDARIEQARQWSEQRAQRTADYARMRLHLTDDPRLEREHPVFARIPRELIEGDAELLPHSAALVKEPELRTWFPSHEQVQPYLEAAQQIIDSPLVLNQSQQGERLQELAARAVGELVSADMAQSWHRRLLEMAYFFDLTKRHAQAKAALAAALALEANGSGAGVPLCEALIRGSLTAHLQMTAEQEQEAARSSLIVTPGQAMRQAEQRRPR